MTVHLVKQKALWEKEFIKNLKACLNDPTKIANAINARGAIYQNDILRENFTLIEINQALSGLDHQDSTFRIEPRLRSELKTAGFSEQNIEKMKPSDIVRYSSAIAATIAIGGNKIFETYQKYLEAECKKLPKGADDSELKITINKDQKAFQTSLYQIAKSIIEQKMQAELTTNKTKSFKEALDDLKSASSGKPKAESSEKAQQHIFTRFR